MNLLLDLGNSRLKWGLTNGTGQPLVAHGSLSYEADELEQLVCNRLKERLVAQKLHHCASSGSGRGASDGGRRAAAARPRLQAIPPLLDRLQAASWGQKWRGAKRWVAAGKAAQQRLARCWNM